MYAIWFNVIAYLLYCEIVATASRICSDPNEEFNDRGCETKCETGISPCIDCYGGSEQKQLTSGCFCKEGTFRDSVSNKCVSQSECTKKICGANQTFTQKFVGGEICQREGDKLIYDWFKCITACECNRGFIRSCTENGKCITDDECQMRQTIPSC